MACVLSGCLYLVDACWHNILLVIYLFTEQQIALNTPDVPVFTINFVWSTSHCYWLLLYVILGGFSGGASGKEHTCQCRRCKRQGFEHWVWSLKIPWRREWLTFPWRREWLPSPTFLPGESHGQRSLAGYSPLGQGFVSKLLVLHSKEFHEVVLFQI